MSRAAARLAQIEGERAFVNARDRLGREYAQGNISDPCAVNIGAIEAGETCEANMLYRLLGYRAPTESEASERGDCMCGAYDGTPHRSRSAGCLLSIND